MGSISWAAKKAGEAAKEGGQAVKGASDSLKDVSENLNDMVINLSPKLEQAVLAACLSYLSQALVAIFFRKRKLRLLHNVTIFASSVAVLMEALNMPYLFTPPIVTVVSGLLTYYEVTEEDEKKLDRAS